MKIEQTLRVIIAEDGRTMVVEAYKENELDYALIVGEVNEDLTPEENASNALKEFIERQKEQIFC